MDHKIRNRLLYMGKESLKKCKNCKIILGEIMLT